MNNFSQKLKLLDRDKWMTLCLHTPLSCKSPLGLKQKGFCIDNAQVHLSSAEIQLILFKRIGVAMAKELSCHRGSNIMFMHFSQKLKLLGRGKWMTCISEQPTNTMVPKLKTIHHDLQTNSYKMGLCDLGFIISFIMCKFTSFFIWNFFLLN